MEQTTDKYILVSTEKYQICSDYYSHSAQILVKKRLKVTHSFYHPEDKMDEQFDYIKALFTINGIATVSVDNYEIRITKGNLFSWEELLDQLKLVIETYII